MKDCKDHEKILANFRGNTETSYALFNRLPPIINKVLPHLMLRNLFHSLTKSLISILHLIEMVV